MFWILLSAFLLQQVSSFGFYSAAGTYLEVGRSIGQAAKKEINFELQKRNFKDKVLPFSKTPVGAELYHNLLENALKHFPHLVDEIRGIAEGSGWVFFFPCCSVFFLLFSLVFLFSSHLFSFIFPTKKISSFFFFGFSR